MEKLKKLNLTNTCSGASTLLLQDIESEVPTEPIGLMLTIFMSSEYVQRELEFYMEFKDGKFTWVKYVVANVGENAQIEKVDL